MCPVTMVLDEAPTTIPRPASPPTFRLRPIMRHGTASSIPETWERYATIENVRADDLSLGSKPIVQRGPQRSPAISKHVVSTFGDALLDLFDFVQDRLGFASLQQGDFPHRLSSFHVARNTHSVLRVSRVSSDIRSSSCAKGPPSSAVFFTRQFPVDSSYSAQMIFVTLPSRSVTQVTWAPSTGHRIGVIAI